MEEYILKDDEKERKKKQEYLIKNIIQEGLDAEKFANFLQSERFDGAIIDNWNQEELETMVALFKRTCERGHPQHEKQYKLESIELDENENTIYVKRVPGTVRPKTSICRSEIFVQITNQEVLDSGIFYGKSIFFHLEVHPLAVKIRRTETEFKWLSETLTKEFPSVPIPPLVKIIDKTFSADSLKLYKKFYEKFINDCARHPELRNSLALDAFFTCLSKEEFMIKQKEIAAYCKNRILVERYMIKKTLDSCGSDFMKTLPSLDGQVTLKISQTLKQHFVCAETQYNGYDLVFDRIEKINIEVEKAYKRLLSANQNLKDAFFELQNISIKSSSGKLLRTKSSLIEDSVFSSINRYFENQSWFIRHRRRSHEKCVQ